MIYCSSATFWASIVVFVFRVSFANDVQSWLAAAFRYKELFKKLLSRTTLKGESHVVLRPASVKLTAVKLQTMLACKIWSANSVSVCVGRCVSMQILCEYLSVFGSKNQRNKVFAFILICCGARNVSDRFLSRWFAVFLVYPPTIGKTTLFIYFLSQLKQLLVQEYTFKVILSNSPNCSMTKSHVFQGQNRFLFFFGLVNRRRLS